MAPITTIVHFEVPAGNVDRFFAFWQDSVKDKVNKQPGLIDGILHRGIDPDGPFQFINVARWDSAEQLESGLRATARNCTKRLGTRSLANTRPLKHAAPNVPDDLLTRGENPTDI